MREEFTNQQLANLKSKPEINQHSKELTIDCVNIPHPKYNTNLTIKPEMFQHSPRSMFAPIENIDPYQQLYNKLKNTSTTTKANQKMASNRLDPNIPANNTDVITFRSITPSGAKENMPADSTKYSTNTDASKSTHPENSVQLKYQSVGEPLEESNDKKMRVQKLLNQRKAGAYESLFERAKRMKQEASNDGKENIKKMTMEKRIINMMLENTDVHSRQGIWLQCNEALPNSTRSMKSMGSYCRDSKETTDSNKSNRGKQIVSKEKAAMMLDDLLNRNEKWMKAKEKKIKVEAEFKKDNSIGECSFVPTIYTHNYQPQSMKVNKLKPRSNSLSGGNDMNVIRYSNSYSQIARVRNKSKKNCSLLSMSGNYGGKYISESPINPITHKFVDALAKSIKKEALTKFNCSK